MIKFFRLRHDKYYHGKPFHLIADIVFASVIILLIIAFFVINNWQPKPAVEIKITKTGDKVVSGQIQSFELNYKALQNISNSSVSINLPDYFTITSVEPADKYSSDSETFKVDNLKRGQSGKIKINGLVIGEIGNEQTLASDFKCTKCVTEIINSLNYKIDESVLKIDLNLPDQVYRGVETGAKLIIKNDGSQELSNIKLKINDSWRIAKSDLALKNNEILIDKIAANNTQEVNISIINSSNNLKSKIEISSFLTIKDKELKQGAIEKTVNVQVPNFKLEASPDKTTANGGETINYTLNFKNQETENLNNLKFNILSGHDDFTISNVILKNQTQKATSKNQTISIIDALKPDEDGQINLAVTYNHKKVSQNVSLQLDILVEYEINGQILKYHVLSAPTKVISTLKVKSGAYYYSSQGDQLGVGPLPPVVDMATKYWIFWEINNQGNELDAITVSANLPEDVIWTDNKSLLAGSLSHGEVSGRVVWQLENISSTPGEELYKVGFEIGIIPEITNIGKVLNLLEKTRFTAHDKFCDRVITGSLKDLDTNLVNDILASGKGEVIASE